jgi:apolipoprotein N-acyltransferase
VAVRTCVALLAGVVLALAFEPLRLVLLMPIAVAAFVLVQRDVPIRRAWLPGLAFGVGFMFTLISWMRAVGPDAWIALGAAQTVWFVVLGPALTVVQRLRGWPFWCACLWVAVEVLRGSWPFGGFPWGRLSFAVVDTPWAAGLPWLGVNGVSLLIALLGTAGAWAVLHAQTGKLAGVGLVAGAGLLSIAPAAAPYHPPDDGRRLTVAAVQGDVPGSGDDILSVHREVTANHVAATVDLAERVARGEEERPDFVLWPENSTAVDPFSDAGVNQGILDASAAIGVPILVGGIVDAPDPDQVMNQGIVWHPGTGGGDRYTKRHPVPFGEYIPWRDRVFKENFGKLALIPRDMASGTRTEPLQIAGAKVADAICFDVAYDDGIAAQMRSGAELLVVQTSNAMFIHTQQIEQQFAISRLRAIETGKYVVVAATNGVSGIIAPDGEVVARADTRTQRVLVDDVVLNDELTLGVRIGPWSGYAAVAVSVGAILCAIVPYRRRKQSSPESSEEPPARRDPTGQDAPLPV